MPIAQLIALLIVVVLIIGITVIAQLWRLLRRQRNNGGASVETTVAQLLRDTAHALPYYGESVALLELVDTIRERQQNDPELIEQLLGYPRTVVAAMLAARAARLEALQAHALQQAQYAKEHNHAPGNVDAHLARAKAFESQAEQVRQLANTYMAGSAQ